MPKPANQVTLALQRCHNKLALYIIFLYIDHDRHFLYSYFQEGKTAAETLKGKCAFKAFAKARGVNINHICTDNGVFNSDLHNHSVGSMHTGRMVSSNNTMVLSVLPKKL